MRSRVLTGAIALAALVVTSAPALAGHRPGGSPERARGYDAYLQAQTLLMSGHPDQAARVLDEATTPDADPGLLLEAAELHRLLDEPEAALGFVERALAARPGWPEALVLRAGIRMDAEDPISEGTRSVALDDVRSALRADPSSVEGGKRLAELCVGADCAAEAARVLAAQAGSDPLPAERALLLARLDLDLGRGDAAVALLRGIIASDPDNLDAADLLATLFEGTHRYEDAIAVYAGILDPEHPSGAILKRVALLQMELDRTGDAVETLLAAEEADPGDYRIRLLLAQVRDNAGDSEGARADCERFLLIEPENLDGLFERARLMRRQGESAAARRAFEDLIERASTRPVPEPQKTTMLTVAWAQVGVLAASARDWDGAAEALEHAVRLAREPQDDLLRLLARAHLERGDTEAADRVARAGLQARPGTDLFEILLAESMLVRGEVPQATAEFEAILARHDHAVETTLGIADTLMRRHHYAEAAPFLAEALRRQPGDDRLLFAQGAVAERLGRFDEAERSLGRAVVANPNNAMALNYLGYMLAQRGRRLPDSVLYVQRAVALDPENPAYLDSLGWALFKLNRFAPAEEMLRTALRYDSFDPAIRDHLGDLLVVTGRAAEAMREWEAAIANGHEEVERIRAKVSRARRTLGTGH
ncbi:MAG TPA: tetratricopeptide repeat protein [Candidatus Polarisedimenticolia bacterium]|nr:tetratricopeptide repeat protein [Candidatus Polarisedimenticolia bacterium]